MKLPGRVARELRRTGKPQRQVRSEADGLWMIAYGLVRNSHNGIQGYLMTRQFLGNAPKAPAEGPAAVAGGTALAELFAEYPALRDDIGRIDKGLSGLDDPVALEMLRRVTVGELAKGLGADTASLASKIEALISSYAGGAAPEGE
jgi:hypothetical protein